MVELVACRRKIAGALFYYRCDYYGHNAKSHMTIDKDLKR